MPAASSTPARPIATPPRLGLARTALIASLTFGLFFGAGNLIFPVEMGRAAGSAMPLASLGFLATAVCLPLLGILACAISGSTDAAGLTRPVGRRYATVFTAALYLTIGPLFAIPRTATVSFEVGIRPLLGARTDPSIPLLVFSLLFFAVATVAALRPGRILDIVGRYLTPIFLVLLATLLIAAIAAPMLTGPLPAPQEAYAAVPTVRGLVDGYQTMDALASVAFAIVVIGAITRMGRTAARDVTTTVLRSGVLAVVAMCLIYAALAYLGATSRTVAPDAPNGGAILAAAAQHYYGGIGQLLIAAIVLVACLKTSIGLAAACAEAFRELFGPRPAYRVWVVVFCAVSAAIANLGLAGIVSISVPVLLFLYPLTIVAIGLGLAHRWVGDRPTLHRVTTLFVGCAAFIDLVAALPFAVPGRDALVGAAKAVLPGYGLGFGWVVPAVVGLVLGAVLSRVRGEGREHDGTDGAGTDAAEAERPGMDGASA